MFLSGVTSLNHFSVPREKEKFPIFLSGRGGGRETARKRRCPRQRLKKNTTRFRIFPLERDADLGRSTPPAGLSPDVAPKIVVSTPFVAIAKRQRYTAPPKRSSSWIVDRRVLTVLSIVCVPAWEPVLVDGRRAAAHVVALAAERSVDSRLFHPECYPERRFLPDRSLGHSGHACTRRGKRQYCQLYRSLALKGTSQHAHRPAESCVDPSIQICRPTTNFDLPIIREMPRAHFDADYRGKYGGIGWTDDDCRNSLTLNFLSRREKTSRMSRPRNIVKCISSKRVPVCAPFFFLLAGSNIRSALSASLRKGATYYLLGADESQQ